MKSIGSSIETPTETELDSIVQQLAHASSVAEKITGRHLDSSRDDLAIIQRILDSNAIEHDSNTLQALGTAFGMVFVETYSGYDWWMVEDEQGRKPAIRFEETSLAAFPLTFFTQNVQNGGKIDVKAMFDDFRRLMDEMGRQQGLAMENVRILPRLADRGERLAARLLDSLIEIPLYIPLIIYLDVFDTIKAGQNVPIMITVMLSLQHVIIFLLLNAYLLHKHGQTIGKHLMNIAITDQQGRKPNVWNIIVLRYFAFWVSGYIPLVGRAIVFLDPLLIFRRDRRCLHDHLAGTIVIKCPVS